MANTIKIKNSGTAASAPSALEHGELAINYADGKIYYKNSSNSIVEFSSSGGITISDTVPLSPSVGDLWYESDTGKTFVYYDSFWVEVGGDGGPAGPQGATGATGASGTIPNIGLKSSEYYGCQLTSTTNFTMVANRTYYMPFYLSEATTFDRIAIRTGSNFSGTATVRLGVYNNSGGIPTTVAFDAGTVSATASNTTYTITINQTLSAGWYWFAANTQAAAATNSFTGSTTIIYLGMLKYPTNSAINFNSPCWIESSITGAFATAGTISESQSGIVVAMRKQ